MATVNVNGASIPNPKGASQVEILLNPAIITKGVINIIPESGGVSKVGTVIETITDVKNVKE